MKSKMHNRPRVHVVDDEHLIANTLAKILNMNGYAASAFYDAETALEVAKTNCPDIFICDVMLVGMNGVDAAIRIKELCPTTRVILFSGQAEASDLLTNAQRCGHSFEILAKPLRPEALLRRLKLN